MSVLTVLLPQLIVAQPTDISITYPKDGSIIINRNVNITGNTKGVLEEWKQTKALDFEQGQYNHTKYQTSKGLMLDGGLYDGFYGTELDDTKWSELNVGELCSSIDNSTYLVSGTKKIQGDCENKIISTCSFNNTVSATLMDFNGFGYYTSVFGINDGNNSVTAGFAYDIEEGSIIIIKTTIGGSSGTAWYYEPIPPKNVNITISWNTTTVSVSIENFLKIYNLSDGWISNSCYCTIVTKVGAIGDSINISWDNVIGERIYSGTYISEIYDMGYPKPQLRRANWSIIELPENKISVAIRSCSNSNMSDPSPWTTVYNDMVSAFPTSYRFLQYCVTFYSMDGIYSPTFKVISILYDKKPVEKVEVSANGGFSWSVANGTDYWYIVLGLQENRNTILVKATYTAGENDVVAIIVDVDTTPPIGMIDINGGKKYTNDSNVILTINASDMYGVSSFITSEDPFFLEAAWQPFCTSVPFRFHSGDGPKTVYIKYKDINGWESLIVNDTIILDTTPPTSHINPISSICENTVFEVYWNGTDTTSGINCYDVQYRDGERPWIDWLVRTNTTQSIFSGIDGHRYSFRVRGIDNTNNIQLYPETGSDFILIRLPKPIIIINHPLNNSILRANFDIEGTTNHQNSNRSIIEVQIRIDDGPWQIVDGTIKWKFQMNIKNIRNGVHVLHARAFDGTLYSQEAVITLIVNISGENVSMENYSVCITFIGAFIIIFICFIIYMILRKGP